MIVKMKKVALLISSRHSNVAVRELRKLGLMHIKHTRKPQADAIDSFKRRLKHLDEALAFLGESAVQREGLEQQRASSYIREIVSLGETKRKLKQRIQELNDRSIWFEEWGNVTSHTLAELKKAGLFIKLYVCAKDALKRLPKDKLFYVVHKKPNEVYIAFVSANEQDSLGFTEIEPPHEDLKILRKRIAGVNGEIECLNKRLNKLSAYKSYFLRYKRELLKNLEFYKVRFGMGHLEDIYCLEGFCPAQKVSKVSAAAKDQGWAIVVQEPDDPQETPTLIRNPKWINIIKPVFSFMGTLPGYKEYDISFWFLLFFSLFFAMLIGDAGYGLVFLIVTLFARKKFKTAPKEPFFLMYVLSAATIAWGAASGTWFGLEKIAHLPFLNSLVVSRINSFVDSNQLFMIYLCFFIGAVHLSIAHSIIAFRFINSLAALAQVGWICIVWAAFFVAGKLVLSRPLPDYTLLLGVLGAGLVILFSNPGKNMLKGALVTLANLPLKVISSFSDVVSYLRLFAVGYATVAVAGTFNNMALGAGFNGFLTGLLAAFILFFGHLLNIALGLMAVIVHGVRLNMLEFSGHLDMEWSGKEYRPFKE